MQNLTKLLEPWIKNVPECAISGLQNDSRLIKPGDVFLAYPGEAADGRQFIPQAIASGASCIVYDPIGLAQTPIADVPCVAQPGLATQLAALASRFYGNPAEALTFTGVTGTNGKTTIAYQLMQAHTLLNQKAAYIGTLGQGTLGALQPLANTTPDALCLQRLFSEYRSEAVKQVCMEVSSHALCQGRVACIDFTQAIFTNLSHEHLDYHQTMTNYAAAKAKLFATSSLQAAIVNADDRYHATMLAAMPSTCQALTYGLQPGCDVYARDWQMSLQGTQVEIISPWGIHNLELQALGKFNIYNGLAVFASLCAMGYPAAEVAKVMKQLSASPGRMEVVAENPCVIVDYAHTPDALQNVLETLQELKRNNKKGTLWVIFGCGGDRDKTKRPLMGRIASEHADKVVITSDNPRGEEPQAILNDIAAGFVAKATAVLMVDRKAAIEYVLNEAHHEDTVLIAGKGHEAYQIIGQEHLEFSDQLTVKHLLRLCDRNALIKHKASSLPE